MQYLPKELEMHIEDDNVRFLRKFLKFINEPNERYGNEILLDNCINFICHTIKDKFVVQILSPNDEPMQKLRTTYDANVDGFSRFSKDFLLSIHNILLSFKNN